MIEPQMGASYDQQLAVARTAEAAGFGAFFRSDHYIAFAGDGLPGPTDSWVTLAGLARETSTIRLGTMVTAATFRYPGPLAISVAQVDVMSGGRVELGLGAAWNDREHDAYGIPFPGMRDRFDMLEEQLEILTGLWRTPLGGSFTHEGRHYRLIDSPALPKPAQDGGPPVVVGGWGHRRTPELAARFAHEFNTPFPSKVDDFSASRQRVRAACEAAGRGGDEIVYSVALTTACGADEGEYERRAAAIGREPADLRGNAAGGTVDEVVETLGRYRDAGAQRAYLQLLDLDDLDHIRLLGEAVMPALR